MYTLHHGFWAYFLTRHHPRVWQFVLGSMFPDYIYVVLLGLLMVKGYVTWSELGDLSPAVLMSLVALYPWVVKIDLIGHSVVVWLGALLLSFLPVVRNVQPFVIGWGSHLLVDALTHGSYSNFFLFPWSRYTVQGPVSYWEHNYWFREYKLVNGTLMIMVGIYMVYEWWKKRQKRG